MSDISLAMFELDAKDQERVQQYMNAKAGGNHVRTRLLPRRLRMHVASSFCLDLSMESTFHVLTSECGSVSCTCKRAHQLAGTTGTLIMLWAGCRCTTPRVGGITTNQ